MNIQQYYADMLGTKYEPDLGGNELPVESNCGNDCKRVIDAAAAFLASSAEFSSDEIETVRSMTLHACEVYWFG